MCVITQSGIEIYLYTVQPKIFCIFNTKKMNLNTTNNISNEIQKAETMIGNNI